MVTPCCGVPVLARPWECAHERADWMADPRLGDRCYLTERPRAPEGRPAEQMRLAL